MAEETNIFSFKDPYSGCDLIIMKSRFDKKFRIYKLTDSSTPIDNSVHKVLTVDEVFLINEELGEEGFRNILEKHHYYSKKKIIELIQEQLKNLTNNIW